jgi:hypothetical protein
MIPFTNAPPSSEPRSQNHLSIASLLVRPGLYSGQPHYVVAQPFSSSVKALQLFSAPGAHPFGITLLESDLPLGVAPFGDAHEKLESYGSLI